MSLSHSYKTSVMYLLTLCTYKCNNVILYNILLVKCWTREINKAHGSILYVILLYFSYIFWLIYLAIIYIYIYLSLDIYTELDLLTSHDDDCMTIILWLYRRYRFFLHYFYLFSRNLFKGNLVTSYTKMLNNFKINISSQN